MSTVHDGDDVDQKSRVLSAISSDLPASDCLVSLFHSALSSYRHDTVLKPFPPDFVLKDGNKDIDGLREVLKDLGPLEHVKKKIATVDGKLLNLLEWILYNKNFVLHSKPVSEFTDIEKNTVGSTHTPTPYAIFELEYTAEQEARWQEVAAQDHGTFLAYHGTRVENLHCISHIGLISHMNKTGVYGEGTYLSTDLGVCMNFSPSANVWRHSMLPPLCSMVAVCQVVSHPEIKSRVQVGGEPSFNQKIPDRYFVVTNDELIRPKYILVFAQETARPRSSSHWVYKHKWTLLVALYIFFLLLVGLMNSRYVTKLYHQYTRRHLTI